jgi:hypothetical protein
MDYDIQDIDGVKIYTAAEHLDCEKKLGKFMEAEDYDLLIDHDADFYGPTPLGGTNGEKNIMFKYRRGIFTEEEQISAYDALRDAAVESQNRGIAAGPRGEKLEVKGRGGREWVTPYQEAVLQWMLNSNSALEEVGQVTLEDIREKYKNPEHEEETRGRVWLRSEVTKEYPDYFGWFDRWADAQLELNEEDRMHNAVWVNKKFISGTSYAQSVNSGIAGFFDRYPRIPYGRMTSYTEQNWDRYIGCYPFMRKLSAKFKELLPERFSVQEREANKLDERFRVAGKDTPFTTITVNKNFRTAAHRDAGDLTQGFSNLSVIAKDKEWSGGYLVLPEFRVAVNIRPGDLLLINNHEGIHGNTELLPPEGKTIEEMERISLVCYFREKMRELGEWEYEVTRREFVDDRRKNKDHELWRPLWNGVSPGMWESQEWYDYLLANGGANMLDYYHPEANEGGVSLTDFA